MARNAWPLEISGLFCGIDDRLIGWDRGRLLGMESAVAMTMGLLSDLMSCGMGRISSHISILRLDPKVL